jgi:transposase
METVEAFALVAGHVDQELLLRNEYLAAENQILLSKLSDRPQLTDSERIRLAKLGKRLGLKALKDVAAIVKPETVLSWYRKLVSEKFDGSGKRGRSGRPRVDEEVEKLVLRMVEGNPTWGYDRVAGALSNVGHDSSDETVGNILKRNGVPPAPRRKPGIPRSEFIGVLPNCVS